MSPLDIAITCAGMLGSAVILAGITARGTMRTVRAFGLYHGFLLTVSFLALVWPGTFYRWSFWSFRMLVLDVLELAVLGEVAYWTFLGFPGAASSARGVILALLVGTWIAVMLLPMGVDASGPLLGGLRARLQIGTAWGFAGLAGLTGYYNLPVRPVHRAIALGMVAKLVLFGEVLGWLAARGPALESILRVAAPASFAAVTCWWAVEAWRREPALTVDAALAARLQPWRVR